MNASHVKGMIIRNLYLWVRDLDRVFDAFWWAFFDIVIWGFLSTYFSQDSGNQAIMGQILAGIIFWSVLARSQWEVSASMLVETWDRNLINIFTSPLTLAEFLTATIMLGIGKLGIVLAFMTIVTFFLYQFNVFVLSWWIVPLVASLFITGVWLSLFINALILRFGKNVMSFAWTLVLIVNPISGVVYPLSALPPALQAIARVVPSSYVFEGMRAILATGSMDRSLLIMSFFLNALYLTGSVLFYVYTFQKAREHGWLIKLA